MAVSETEDSLVRAGADGWSGLSVVHYPRSVFSLLSVMFLLIGDVIIGSMYGGLLGIHKRKR